MEDLNQEKHIGMLLRDVHKDICNLLNKDLDEYGITMMQYEVLNYIHLIEKKRDINQKDIEKFFNSTNPTITGILSRLQAKDLVTRQASTEDARYKIIKLTDIGRGIVDECHNKKSMMEERLTKNLSLEEQEQLRYLLKLVIKGLK
ncbi:MAG: MarR family transcriptional regulator [Cellulosilyticum sp.]|nr:MarR family transcriptional regulator [Cellulosilyticum sp.]